MSPLLKFLMGRVWNEGASLLIACSSLRRDASTCAPSVAIDKLV